MTDYQPISPEVRNQARASIQQVHDSAPLIKGPALVYVGWNGASCGNIHNFVAIKQAADKLAVPLYVINSSLMTGSPNQPLGNEKPGKEIRPNSVQELIKITEDYSLFPQDGHIRLIDASGNVVGSSGKGSGVKGQADVLTKDADAIVRAFQGFVNQMRPSAELPRVGFGRA